MNLIRFNKTKCELLHLGHDNLHYQYKMEDVKMDAKKDSRVLVDGSLTQASSVPQQPSQPHPDSVFC